VGAVRHLLRHGGQAERAAGYDPAESLNLWDRMAAASGGSAPPEFMSTHPANDTRKNNLKGWLPAASAEYQKSAQKYGLGANIK